MNRVFRAQNGGGGDSYLRLIRQSTSEVVTSYFEGNYVTVNFPPEWGGEGATLEYYIPALANQYFQVRVNGTPSGSIFFDGEGNGSYSIQLYGTSISFGDSTAGFWYTNVYGPSYIFADIRTPIAGRVSMIAASPGYPVSTSSYFLRVTPTGGGSDVLVFPPRDGICVSVNVTYNQTVTANQIVGTMKYLQ